MALGPDLPALFARRDETADAFLAAGKANDDAGWRLPLHEDDLAEFGGDRDA